MISGIYSLRNKLLGVAIGFSLAGLAQESTLQMPDSVKTDSTRNISFLIVPFNPAMYFSDADNDIAEVSNISKDKVRGRFNGSMEGSLADKLSPYYEVKMLSRQKDADGDMDIIFGSVNYLPAVKTIPEKKQANPKQGERIKDALRKKPAEKQVSYMDISFDDDRLTGFLAEKYGVKYFIFINQFEVKTDYENCLDLALRKYAREITVHYTVLDKAGKKIGGDVIVIPYHSNENKIEQIVKDNFGLISTEITTNIYFRK